MQKEEAEEVGEVEADDGQVEKVDYLEAYLAEAKRLNMAVVDQAIQSNNTDQLQIEGGLLRQSQQIKVMEEAVELEAVDLLHLIKEE